ncbi:nucleotide-sugar transporter [Hesseltinella vesiculosa]|uniref:Nucleotide-sugar transporter n=1 Tax=Hesseltinella vesiculosa TaxID=101127 RepID=A0A1X2GUL5_9FUNG|nr:nucleotide-sugar transporter [Hesseltinella vesiculosa]
MGFTSLQQTIPLKYLSLMVLVVQNSALILVMRYTRASVPEDQLYLASTAVVMNELLKCLASIVLLHFSGPVHYRTWHRLTALLHRELIVNWKETAKLAIPATLYLIQNNLQYVAATNLDAATFQVTYQLKILTTAFFSVVILKRSLSQTKWLALGLLTMGIALVVLPKDASTAALQYFMGGTAEEEDTAFEDDGKINLGNQSNMTGYTAVLMACVLSGLAGVYFEMILKAPNTKPTHEMVNTKIDDEDDHQGDTSLLHDAEEMTKLDKRNSIHADATSKRVIVVNHADEENDVGARDVHGRREDMLQTQQQNQLWIRNLQMSLFSIVLGLVFTVFLQDGAVVMEKGFFVNYNALTWLVIFIQTAGGLIVAVVVKYADNVLKGFATSISIILSSVVSVWAFNSSLSSTFVIGTALVIYATYLYGL